MKHKLYRKLTAFLCAFALTPAAYAAERPAVSNNHGRYNYSFYAASVKKSYLFANTQGD